MTTENDLVTRAIKALARIVFVHMPGDLVECYRKPAGIMLENDRRLRLHHIAEKLSDDDLAFLIKDVADATLFYSLGGFDEGLGDLKVKLQLSRSDTFEDRSAEGLIEAYRQQVDPGGILDT